MTVRAAFYIDGFNLYHAIDELNKPYLKWISLIDLATILIPKKSEHIVKLIYCTAFYPNAFEKRQRNEKYTKAQRFFGGGRIEIVMGHYVDETLQCRSSGNIWNKPTEKETDFNVALALIDDAYQDIFDHAYLVTNDSDQAATAKVFAKRFPHKRLTSVCPPGRRHSKHILEYCQSSALITLDHLEKALMESQILTQGGLILRPADYAPPKDWVHPKNRP